MPSHKPLNLNLLPNILAVCRLTPFQPIPFWALQSSFYSISKTPDELSIVCDQAVVPPNVKSEPNWRCLKIIGPLEFGLTGILASIANVLAESKISIFAVSTFDTDYILIKQESLDYTLATIVNAGHRIRW